MMEVLAVTGSPRRNGNCSVLLDELASGLGESGHRLHLIRLDELRIRPCTACRACKAADAMDCVIDDDMRDIYPWIRRSPALVIASPIYWWSVSAQTKLFLDRCDALDGPSGSALRGKSVGVLLAYGGDSVDSSGAVHAIRLFQSAAAYIGFELTGIVHGTAWEPGEIRRNRPVLEDARQLGRLLARRLDSLPRSP
jgi:multimeric flavodoxin WrbA